MVEIKEFPAGNLDRRITIESETITRDEWGGEVLSWATLASVWAGIDYNTAGETVEAEQQTALSRINFIIRYRTDLTSRMRVYYNFKYFTITGIKEIGRQVGNVLQCELRDHQ